MNILFNLVSVGSEYQPQTSTFTDGAFDTISVSSGSSLIQGYYVTDPSAANLTLGGSTWSFPPFGGIVSSTSSYASGVTGGSGNPQVGMIVAGRMSKAFSVTTTGTYNVTFNSALSPVASTINPVIPQHVTCGIFSGSTPDTPTGFANLGSFDLTSTAYSAFTSSNIALTAGTSYTIVFSSGAWRQLSADYILIDNVSLVQVA